MLMGQDRTLHHKSSQTRDQSPAKASPKRDLRGSFRFALNRNKKPGLLALLAAILFLSLITLFLSLVAFQLDPIFIATLFIFGILCLWVGSMLEYILHPERLAYRQAVETCNQVVKEITDQDLLLDQITHILYTTLEAGTVSLWRYRAETKSLSLLRLQGTMIAADLAELPIDIAVSQVLGTCALTDLPPSALRRGLTAAGVRVVAALSQGDELIGLIGLGSSRTGNPYSAETLHWLEGMTGQLALIVKNAWLVSDLEETLNKLQMAYRRTIDAQEEERRSLATEIHDDILGRLTTMALTLRNSQKSLETQPDQVQIWLRGLEKETQELNRRLREITQGLHPSVLADLGLISALRSYMDTLARQPLPSSAPSCVTLTTEGFNGDRIADPKLERDLYYVTRQALDNAIAHAGAEQVFIHLGWRDQAISVTVQDTGQGMRDAPEALMGLQGHLGLLSMNERVQAWKGQLSFSTEAKKGTTVHIRVPTEQTSHAPTHLQAFNHYLRQVVTHQMMNDER